MLLAAAWAGLVLDGVRQTRREHAARARLGPVVLRAWQPSVAAGLAVLVTSLAGAVVLERALGRFAFRPGAALVGLVLAAGSFLAHPSPASACLGGGFAVGVVLKAWLEERALRGVLGEEYARYAARVPALIPWPRARARRDLPSLR